MKYFNLYAEFQFLYFISTPSNHLHSTFGFTFNIKISMCYPTFTLPSLTSYALYLLLLTICQLAFGFTLDIKIRKIIQNSVLSFPGVLKVANFLFPSLSQFFFYCWIETCCPDILHQLCTVLIPLVPYVVHVVGFLGCVTLFNFVGEYCESIPLNHTGSYVLSA